MIYDHMNIELFLKTPKNGVIQAFSWFCSSVRVIRGGSFSQYLNGAVSSADGQLFNCFV